MGQKKLKIIAIIAAYNEGDVIYHVVRHLVENGMEVYFIDNNSTDNTVEEVSKWLGKGLMHIERFPQDCGYDEECKDVYVWSALLQRKEELQKKLNADWYLHYDADEFRESPWVDLSLREGIELVDKLGFNCIDFECLNFKPVDNSFQPGTDIRDYLLYYNLMEGSYKQIKCWKYFGQEVDLVSSGGHEAIFSGRKIFPIKFIMLHYPIRSQEHGLKKVYGERLSRYSRKEREKGWHIHYKQYEQDTTANFLFNPVELIKHDPVETRRLAIIRGIERDIAELKKQKDEEIKQKDAMIRWFQNSKSWRITSPLRWLDNFVKKIIMWGI